MSPTGRSAGARKFRISRRRGSATALKLSEVVGARGMRVTYVDMGICQVRVLDFDEHLERRDTWRWRLVNIATRYYERTSMQLNRSTRRRIGEQSRSFPVS